MSESDRAADAQTLAALPKLPRDEGGPVFAEPWQAQAFALAVKLSEQGHFTWKEWAATLAEELAAAAARGEPDDGSHYYDHWLAPPSGSLSRRASSTRLRSPSGRKPGPMRTATRRTASRSNGGHRTTSTDAA